MKVYLAGERARTQARHDLHIAPAAHLRGQEVPLEWVDEDNQPKNFTITFKYGEAEVPSNVGDYLVKYGMAKQTALILPSEVAAF